VQAILGSIVGGMLAIAGGLLVGVTADRRQRRRWQYDNQLKVGSELLGSLQLVVRRLRDIAYLEDKKSSTAIRANDAFHDATTRWNTAMYAALIAAQAATSDILFSLDREVDRLSDVAKGRALSTIEFRAERRHRGRHH
jgi:hypothetical protein